MSQLSRIQRIAARVERAELASLRARCEQLHIENQRLRDALREAENLLDFWHGSYMRLSESLSDSQCLGITRDGTLGVLDRQP